MLDYQSSQLRKLIGHAYANVHYYRRLFDSAGLKPRDIRDINDLSRIPITRKPDLQMLPLRDRLARGISERDLILRKTGGSTGTQIVIRRTWLEERLLNAFRFRARRALGLRITDRIASVGLVRTVQHADRQMMSQLLQSMGLLRVTKIDCRQPIPDITGELDKLQPDVITGYAGTIARVAQEILNRAARDGCSWRIRPRFVTTGAEVQTPLMREQIRQAFGCPVYNVYGAHEFNLVACECPATGQLHTCDDLVIVEVLRGNVSVDIGQRGEVVATNLHSFAMPFIRYRLDDVVTRGPDRCPCGAPFATIHSIQGRMLDHFPLPDGRLIHPYQIIDTLLHDRIKWMRQYQLVQERPDLIILRVVAHQKPTPQRLAEIHSDARKLFGARADLRIDWVDEISAEPNGKYRLARSELHSNYTDFDWERVSDAR